MNEAREVRFLSIAVTGVVTNGVVVTNSPLPEGAKVEVVVVAPTQAGSPFSSALEFLESLPPGPRAFKTWDEYEQHLRGERNSWER